MFDPVTGTYADTTADMIEDVSNYNADLILDDGTGLGPAVYVVGGYDKDGGSGGGGLGLVQRYYPQFNLIEALPPIDDYPGQIGGIGVAGMGTAVVDEIIYVYGGWQSTVTPYFYSATWAFDPNQPSGARWTNLGVDLNPGRAYIQSAVHSGKIYAMGGISGYVGGDLVPTDVVEVLDTANLAAGWTPITSLPLATAEGRGFGFYADTLGVNQPWPNALYLAGGGDWPDYSTEVMEYDLASETWDQGFPDLNVGRVNHAGVLVPLWTSDPSDGLPGMWVFGGRSLNGCDPPYAPTEFYPLSTECFGLTSAEVLGPGELPAGEVGIYSVALEPPTATLPIDIEWNNGETGTPAAYSWEEPGIYTVVVTGTNCEGGSVVTDSLEVSVTCVALTEASIDGPTDLLVGEAGVYTVDWLPENATAPAFEWIDGTTGISTTLSWDEAGSYTVVVTGTNCEGDGLVTDTLDVNVTCVALVGASIAGPDDLLAGETGVFTVTWEPENATDPSIEWSNGLTDTITATYSWAEPGSHTVAVTLTNCGDVEVKASTQVGILGRYYLPLIVKDS
jgi:hypothetical protein